MPGLFGIICVAQQQRPSVQELATTFEAMANRLCHHEPDVIERWFDTSSGLFIGRCGQPHLHHFRWPDQTGARSAPHTFGAGVLHPGVGRSATDRDPVDTILTGMRHRRGFYSLVHWEPSAGECLIAVDRRASIPVFFAEVDGILLFAPEVKALLAWPRLQRALDTRALATLLTCGHLMADQTLLRDVRRLRGGEAPVRAQAV
jgi:hypothetical protein